MMIQRLAALLAAGFFLAVPVVAQNLEINQLPAVTTPADTDELATDQSGAPETRKITRAQIVAGVLALLQAHEALTTGAHSITAFTATLLDDVDAATARTTLGLGTAATSATGDFEAAGAVATHESDTTSVHGIADTSVLVVDSDLGTAAALDVPAAGDAAVGEVVKGDDTRLTDARTPTSHAHAGEDVTSGTVAAARLGEMTGDAGAGGAKGAVPAPGAGDAAAGKFLKADATWAAPGGGIGGSTGATDNAILRADGTGGATVQDSGVTIDDSDVIHIPGTGTEAHITFGGTASSDAALGRNTSAYGSSTSALHVYTGSLSNWNYLHALEFFLSNTGMHVGQDAAKLSLNSTNGVLVLQNDSATMSHVLSAVLVEANTAGSGAPNVLSIYESGTCINNNGATALVYQTLPAAAAGLTFCGCVTDSDGLRFTAVGDDTIRSGGTVTGAAGYMESTQVGDCWELRAQDSASWYVVNAWPTTASLTLSAP